MWFIRLSLAMFFTFIPPIVTLPADTSQKRGMSWAMVKLQDSFGIIMLALVDGHPRVLNLKEILVHYLNHQKEVITRRTRYELGKAKDRAHILEGLKIALDNLDAVINTIRSSANADIAKTALVEKFTLSLRQAQAILDHFPKVPRCALRHSPRK